MRQYGIFFALPDRQFRLSLRYPAAQLFFNTPPGQEAQRP